MTRPEYLKAFLSLIQDEGPFVVMDFRQENDDTYWLTLHLPDPFEGFEAKNLLFALDFESVNFKDKTVRFVIAYPDLVSLVERTQVWLKEEPFGTPLN